MASGSKLPVFKRTTYSREGVGFYQLEGSGADGKPITAIPCESRNLNELNFQFKCEPFLLKNGSFYVVDCMSHDNEQTACFVRRFDSYGKEDSNFNTVFGRTVKEWPSKNVSSAIEYIESFRALDNDGVEITGAFHFDFKGPAKCQGEGEDKECERGYVKKGLLRLDKTGKLLNQKDLK